MSSEPRVVILCGGQGTRLREETEYRPKPMVTVGGRPLLWHIMQIFGHHDFTSFVLCLGYKGEMIRDYFLNYREQTADVTVQFGRDGRNNTYDFHDPHDIEGWDVTLADTGPLTQTGGRIHRVRRYLGESTFFMTYGDGVADVDIKALWAQHKASGKLATVTGFRPLSRFGVMERDAEGHATGFREKPRMKDWISGGFFVLEPGVFDYLDPDCVFEREPLSRLAADGQLGVHTHEGYWQSIDTYREYLDMNRRWDAGDRPWAVWEGA